jgi:cytoskeletal protein CcmA (bactofilin family)
MFSKQITTDVFTDIISSQTSITGTVNFSGVLKVQGKVNGNITSTGSKDTIHCDVTGDITSTSLTSHHLILAGKVKTDLIQSNGVLRILKTAKIEDATIEYARLEIEPGAYIHNCKLVHKADQNSKK